MPIHCDRSWFSLGVSMSKKNQRSYNACSMRIRLTSLVLFEFLFLTISSLAASQSSVTAPAGLESRISLDVAPHSSLENALIQVSVKSGIQVMMDALAVHREVPAPIKGTLVAREALATLLAGSDLSYTVEGRTLRVFRVADTHVNIMSDAESSASEKSATTGEGGGVTDPSKANAKKMQASDANPRSDARQTGLEEVLVSAQKRSEKAIDVPLSMQVVSGNELESRQVDSLSALAGYVAGLSVSNSGSPGQNGIVIRGLSTGYNNSFSAPLVATYIDDEPIGSSSTGARSGFFGLDLMPYDLDHIEVLRGPQGTLYGADAMGGLVKYVLRKPNLVSFETHAGVDVEHVNASGGVGRSFRASFNAPLIADHLAFRISGYLKENAGYIDNLGTGRDDSNSSKIYGGRATLLWKATDRLSIQATALAQSIFSDDNSAVTFDAATNRPIYGRYAQSSRFPQAFSQQTRDFSLHIDWDLDFATLTSSSSYSHLRSQLGEDFSPASPLYLPAFPDALSLFQFTNKVSKYVEELRLTSPDQQSLQWLFGGIYTRERPSEFDNWPAYFANGTPLPAPYTNLLLGNAASLPNYRESAVFGTLTYKFTSAFDISGGVRYADNAANGCVTTYGGLYGTGAVVCGDRPSQNVWTWMTDARFHLNADQMVYGRVATGYRPGFGCTTCGNAALNVPGVFEPDKTTNYEVGFKGQFLDRRLQIDAAAFYVDWRDIQVQVVNSSGFGYTGNGGTASSQGLELTTGLLVTQGLRLNATLAYTNARLTEDAVGVGGKNGDPLPESPRFTGSLTADYTKPLSGGMTLLAGAGYRYKDGAYNQFKSSAYPYPMGPQNLVDLYGGVQLEKLTVRVYGQNVTNNHSYTGLVYAVDPTRPMFVPIKPFTVGLSLDYRF